MKRFIAALHRYSSWSNPCFPALCFVGWNSQAIAAIPNKTQSSILFCSQRILRFWKRFFATSGPHCPAKYQLCTQFCPFPYFDSKFWIIWPLSAKLSSLQRPRKELVLRAGQKNLRSLSLLGPTSSCRCGKSGKAPCLDDGFTRQGPGKRLTEITENTRNTIRRNEAQQVF